MSLSLSLSHTRPSSAEHCAIYHVPAADVSQVDHHVHLRGPQVDLPLPGRQRGERHDQQEGSVQLVLVEQVVEEADRLDGFAQTHLVSQDAAVASVGKHTEEEAKARVQWIKTHIHTDTH